MGENNNKRRLLVLLRYLYEFTDTENKVTTQQLIDMLSENGCKGNRMTVKDDVDTLISAGYDIIIDKGATNEFCYGSKVFELPELKLLIDAVSSCRFISAEKSDALIDKLAGFAGPSERKKLTKRIHTSQRVKSDYKKIYLVIDEITQAIDEKKQLSFQYIDYNQNREQVLRHGGEIYTCSPYALFWNDDRYYLISHSMKHWKVVTFRVDRMINLKLLSDEQLPPPEDFSIEVFAKKVIKMYDGEEQEVTLSCENQLMINILDRFGEEVQTQPIDENHFAAVLKVQTSPTFYSWIFQFAGMIRIISPEPVRREYQQMLMAQIERQIETPNEK